MEPNEDPQFIQYQKQQYENYKRVQQAQKDIQDMLEDMRILTKEQLVQKYGRPQREFALLQWELHKAKKGMRDRYDTEERRKRESAENNEVQKLVRFDG